jgi:hypothetical protein
MGSSIMQWNCRGLRANYNELELLLSRQQPSAVCLQEIQLPTDYALNIRGYSVYKKCAVGNAAQPVGGVSVLVPNKIAHSEITINTTLQAVAVRISSPKPITVCSIYLPPNSTWNSNDLLNLTTQLMPPVLLLGDFNAHGTLWGCRVTDRKGNQIEDLLAKSGMCLLNNKSATYLHPATGTYSSIDLSICDPSLFLDFNWQVYDDLCGSDHFPILLQSAVAAPDAGVSRWKLNKAKLDDFHDLCSSTLVYEDISSTENPLETFTELLLAAATQAIPKSGKGSSIVRKVWFSDECKDAICERKRALQIFKSA